MISNVDPVYRSHSDTQSCNLWGKTVVIVGDIAGVGRATAALFVECGAKVFIGVSNPAELSTAFATIARTGGEWDGMAVDFSLPGAVRRFFDQAEQRLGRIDVLVNALAEETIPMTGSLQPQVRENTLQNQCIHEALTRMQDQRGSCVINLRLNGQAGLPAGLRRAAGEHGVRMTVIEPGGAVAYGPGGSYESLQPEDFARCVYESLVQPYQVDVVFLRGQIQNFPL